MKEMIKELNKKYSEYVEIVRNYDDAIDKLAKLEFNNKAETIDDLRQRMRAADVKLKEYYDAIIALRKVCTHNNPDGKSAFRSSGNDSHYSYEKCDICGFEIKV